MKKKKLYYATEDDFTELTWNPELFDNFREASSHEITLEQLADMFDQHAESINAHDFVTTHRALAALLYKNFGREIATKVLMSLVDFKGLHGLTGIGGRTNPDEHEKELHVPLNNWKDWSLGI